MSNLGASCSTASLASELMPVTACFNLQALQLIMLPYHVCNLTFALIISLGPTSHDISLPFFHGSPMASVPFAEATGCRLFI